MGGVLFVKRDVSAGRHGQDLAFSEPSQLGANARNQGAERAAAQRPTAPSGGRSSTSQVAVIAEVFCTINRAA
jgi:hypothetical protein